MIRERRHHRILELIRQEKLVTVQDLSHQLGVSYMTITRDLEELESRGHLQRVRGGAISPEEETDTAFLLPSRLYDPKLIPHYEQKIAIARYAAEHLVEDGNSITIEAGSTVSLMVPYLRQTGLTILTNGLLVSMLAAPLVRNTTVICSGGILIDTGAFIGPQAEECFSKFRVKKVFVGAQGFTLEDGFTDPTPLYTHLKNVMKQNTEKIILLIDSSKFGIRSLVQVLDIGEVNTIVTDAQAPQQMLSALQDRGVNVCIASN